MWGRRFFKIGLTEVNQPGWILCLFSPKINQHPATIQSANFRLYWIAIFFVGLLIVSGRSLEFWYIRQWGQCINYNLKYLQKKKIPEMIKGRRNLRPIVKSCFLKWNLTYYLL